MDVSFHHLLTLAAAPLHGRQLFPWAVRLLHTLDDVLFTLVPGIRRYAWVVALVLRAPRKPAEPAVGVESTEDQRVARRAAEVG